MGQQPQLQDWYGITRHDTGVTAIHELLRAGTEVKSFLVEGERDVAVIDTGTGLYDYAALVASLSDRHPINLQTHGHWDHVGSCHQFARVLIHPEDVRFLREGDPNSVYRSHFGENGIPLDRVPAGFDLETAKIPGCEPSGELHDGDTIDLGGRVLEVVHTPGHSPGSVSFLDRAGRYLIAGDVVRKGTILLMLDGSDPRVYRQTLERIVGLLDAVDVIYSGHTDPMTPDDIRALRDAYESVCAGNVPSTPEAAPPTWRGDIDVHVVEPFMFLVPRGTFPL
jgi:glyoxylase-like metal-dependent hydrolase (beta-lactamase superfamily II)